MGDIENNIDTNFVNIYEISSEIFELARKKMAGKKVKLDKSNKEIEEKLENLLNGVNFINEIEAKRLISETILDLNYITNPEVKVLSLRLGQIYKKQDKEV